MHHKSLNLVWGLVAFLCLGVGCKESRQAPVPRKNTNAPNISQVASNIERMTAGEMDVHAEPAPAGIPRKTQEIHEIPVAGLLDKSTDTVSWDAKKRVPLSQFPCESTPHVIRISVDTRGISKTQAETVENRIIDLLSARLPQPWILKKGQAIDSHDEIWAHLHVHYRRSAARLRKASKTAPLRARYRIDLDMSITGQKNLSMAWNGYHVELHDEISVSNESSIDTRFWKKLEEGLPLFTAISHEQTVQWLRAHGLLAQVLTNELSSFKLPPHQYYQTGCLLAGLSAPNTHVRKSLYDISSPYSPPQMLDLEPLALSCVRDATFIVAQESTAKLALYYQPQASAHAWKTLLTFQDPVRHGDVDIYVDDGLICIYSGNPSGTVRSVEVQCLDRKTGLIQWKTGHLPGSRRGFGYDAQKFVLVNEQAVMAVTRQGELQKIQRIQTSGRVRSDMTCQLQNRLIFMASPNHLVSLNLDTLAFDWETTALDPSFIHCSHQNTLIYFDAGGYLVAFDVEKNVPLWKYRTMAVPGDALTYGDNIYLLFERAILVLDRASGQLNAQIPLPWVANRLITIGSHIYIDTNDAIYTWK